MNKEAEVCCQELEDEIADLHAQLAELSRRVDELETWRRWKILEEG